MRAHGTDTRSTPILDMTVRVWLVLLCTVIVAVPGFLAPREVAQASSAASAALDQMSDLETQLRNAWVEQNWPLAIQTIEQILTFDATRADMLENLYSAHVNYGYQLYAQAQHQQAYEEFESALQINPTGEDAQTGISLILQVTGTPGPTSTSTPVTPGAPTITPSPGPSPTGTLPAAPIQHVVVTGDTLYSLARYYQTTIQAIMWANGLWSYTIYVGQPLYIPTAAPSGGGVHVVQWGETLCSIARLYNTTVGALMVANGLTSDFILAGMELNIP